MEDAPDADWDINWQVHVMSHVWAARALVPKMLARGSGYLINTASAAGLLTSLNSMSYGVTKSAAVSLAEHLSIQYGDRGIRVSVLCPQSVQTGMTKPGPSAARVDGIMTADEVAKIVLEAMEAERFMILSHATVHEYETAQGVEPRALDRRACGASGSSSTGIRRRSGRSRSHSVNGAATLPLPAMTACALAPARGRAVGVRGAAQTSRWQVTVASAQANSPLGLTSV